MCRVISGPQVRRVEDEYFSVQVVLEEDVDLHLCIYHKGELLKSHCDVRKVPLSSKLFFYILKSEVDLCSDELYSYDVIHGQVSIIKDLSLGLVEESELPSFTFGSERILTGSCRQLSSEQDDCLPKMLDRFNDDKLRPQVLILTGDQVYADDLCSDLLDKIKEICQTYDLPTTALDLKDRKDFCQSIGLTSMKSSHHLLSLGEFIALYLLSWSEELWEKDSSIVDLRDLKKVRKLFANVPTYMQMDDHDVSDDLKINEYWLEGLKEQGQRVVANAYATGYLFQIMGNYKRYRTYDELIVAYLKEEVHDCSMGRRIINDADWSNELILGNKAFVFFDTRNHRLGGSDSQSPAGLIIESKLKKQLSKCVSDELVIISPSPVYGYEPIESLQERLAFLPQSVSLIDREGWHAPPKGSEEAKSMDVLEALLSMASAKRIVIISGDVHYSFVRNVNLCNKQVTQVVSSSLKNKPPLTLLARLGFNWYNKYSKNTQYLSSDQGQKIIHHSNYCFLILESEIEICMYSRGIEHKFKLDNVTNDLDR
ncbi:peptide methionine sulfoxide reductase [Lentisphaera araneosa HTCC2155]|uniref:Peptide methionine sulfoxide reductase n=1 Tax=Lentisphaera araneosa HTCC2155 TaxID=313628 RepID=A6DLP0_9BACT|nr:hypothetical protein [Lentisphaera araneosa]EDM27495.1 peptide methionine sulfoxide reductase [Lentisphaera araneosa HTCC2155]